MQTRLIVVQGIPVSQAGGGKLLPAWAMVGAKDDIENGQGVGEIPVVVLGIDGVVYAMHLRCYQRTVEPGKANLDC